MTPPRLRDVLARLRAEGLYRDAPDRPLPATFDAEPVDDPWYIRALIAAGAWIAALLFILFLVATTALRSEAATLGTGAALLAGALGLRHAARGLFLHQLAFALSLAGQVLLTGGLGRMLDWDAAVWGAALALEVLLIVAYPDPLHRFVSTLLAVTAGAVLLHALEALPFVHVLVLGAAAGATGLWERETALVQSRAASLVRPVAYGLAGGLLGLLTLPATGDGAFAGLPWWPSTLGLAVVLGVLLYRLLHETAASLATRARLLTAVALLVPLTSDAPGLPAALLVLVLGFRHGRRLLMGLALAFLALFLTLFYYNLNLTLLAKSFLLMGTGLALLAVRAFGLKGAARHPEAPKEEAANRPPRSPAGASRMVILATGLLVLATLNLFVLQKERLRTTGRTLFVELGVRDPRALLQGDYMVLRYALPDTLTALLAGTDRRSGRLVVRVDARGVATPLRPYTPGEPLAPDEHLLRYHRRDGALLLGPSAFFFQEGHAERYANARYAELRVAGDGEALLVGLRDAGLRPLGP